MIETMDDGEVELSDNVQLSNPDSSIDFPATTSIDSFLDDLLKNTRTCTHTHTCNPPGPEAAHTHTCYHTHTQVLSSQEDEQPNNKKKTSSKPRRQSGNREAVRKYREKKKAHTAYLEEEVKKLRLLNQQLVRKLQGQTVLEAEALRLRSLFLDLRGKIDHELGIFPFQKQSNGTTIYKEGDCGVQSTDGAIGLQCQTNLTCSHPNTGSSLQSGVGNGSRKMMVSWEENCQPAIIDCSTNEMVNSEGKTMETVETLGSSASQAK
nr:basic leucine zipper 23-like [Quercus suber]XP_023897191.1 basic leucine zipper 23-like [Quercus suber]POE55059.1 basic leucine zipper 23 [Quercus suber]